MTRKDSAKKRRILEAGIAVTLDGTVLLSLSQTVHETDRATLMKLALDEPGDIFVGVALDQPAAAQARRWLEDAGIEAAARLYGERRRRGTTRKRRKTTS